MFVPSVSQTVVIATATIAVFGWMSHCGPTIPMSDRTKLSRPRLGLNSSSQMIDPTDAEIAMVLDIIVRKTLMPRSRWFRRTARTSPRAMPNGTVYRTKSAVASRPEWKMVDAKSSVY